jgi:uncharacterized protein involved in high-affinity Fe2+ transport
VAFFGSPSAALEFPVGQPVVKSGMEIAAVYLQPIEMEPAGMMAPASVTDIHLEADIHATAENGNGFAEGDWLPNLSIEYTLAKEGDDAVIRGVMMPMVASDGPHYGDNVKLLGPGRYSLQLTVSFGANGHQMFGRHVDKETGVAAWPAPIVATYDFVFSGTEKKGGY